MITYICKICSKQFESSDKTRITCSKGCSNVWNSQVRKGQALDNLSLLIDKGKDTKFQKGREATNKLNLTKEELERLYIVNNLSLKKIGELFICSPSTVLFYIKQHNIPSKSQGFQKGNRIQSKATDYNWKGGIAPVRKGIRSLKKYNDWRNSIFTRDQYTCQHCSQIGGDLNAHHIISFSSIIRKNNIDSVTKALNCNLLWDIQNGITLCRKCHDQVHIKGEKDA